MEIICKAMGAVLVMGATGYYAVCAGKTMEERNNQLKMIYGILLQLKSEIRYLYNPLPECFRKLEGQAKEPFKTWSGCLSDRMEQQGEEDFSMIWQEELEKLYQNSALWWSDLEPLTELSGKLGQSDVTLQEKAIDYTLLLMEQNRKTVVQSFDQKKKVVVTLCIFAGLMTLILLL